MKFKVITLMPDLIEQGLSFGVVGSSFKKQINQLETINPRDFTEDTHQTVDDRPFGGGDGMLMMAEPLQQALVKTAPHGPIYYLSPQGETLTDSKVRALAKEKEITLICGRYGGVDQRFLNQNPQVQEVSIGDYVLSGGELAALVMIDSISRHIPQVLGHSASASEDSFKNQKLEAPHFTRPQLWREQGVPQVLLSGDHKKIHAYKESLRTLTTLLKRPDLLDGQDVSWQDLLEEVKSWPQSDWESLGMEKAKVVSLLQERL